MSEAGTERCEGQVCPNEECHIDQRFRGFWGLACPECACRLVVACAKCDSGAVEEIDGSARCSDHAHEIVADGGTVENGTEQSGGWESHWPTDPTLTSGARDGFTLNVNETQLLFRTYGQHTPMLVEIWVEDESEPLGAINTAKGETVCLGGVEESLADRIDEIREMPVEEIPEALEQLAYRLNPAGREEP